MKFVLIHIDHIPNFHSYDHCNDGIPEYLWHSILQIKKWGNEDILLIANENKIESIKIKMKEYGLSKLSILPYNRYLDKFNIKGSNFFRFVTYFRLIVLYEAMKQFKFENVCHIEYDNLIYFNENELCLKDRMYFPLVADNFGSAGIMFINNHENFKSIIDLFYTHYHNEAISDMNLLYQCKDFDNVITLPITHDHKNISLFNGIFDGASWGQYVGGTPHGDKAGFCVPFHYVGKRLLNKEYAIGFSKYKDKNIPIVTKDNTNYRLFNLHIHCKQLKDFLS